MLNALLPPSASLQHISSFNILLVPGFDTGIPATCTGSGCAGEVVDNTKGKRSDMFSDHMRPFAAPGAVIYSYELSKLFLDCSITSLLEVGCGIGTFAFRFAAQRSDTKVVGVDRSEKTIDFLSANYGRYYQNLQLRTCDFCQDDCFLGSTFDAIYSSDVIEHVANTQSFVKNLHRHLRAGGGRAVLNFPNQTAHGINHFNEVDDLRKLFSAFADVKVFSVRMEHIAFRSWFQITSAYERLFNRSGMAERKRLYNEREEQGIDCFEDSPCFRFVTSGGRASKLLASLVAEGLLLMKPSFEVRHVERGNILEDPRLVVVATK